MYEHRPIKRNRRGLWLQIVALVVFGGFALLVVSLPFGVEHAPSPGAWYYAAIAIILAGVVISAYVLFGRSGVPKSRAIVLATVAGVMPYGVALLVVWIFVSVQS